MSLKRLSKKKADAFLPKARKKFAFAHCEFAENQEAELLRYIFNIETGMYGFDRRDVRRLAFQLAGKKQY